MACLNQTSSFATTISSAASAADDAIHSGDSKRARKHLKNLVKKVLDAQVQQLESARREAFSRKGRKRYDLQLKYARQVKAAARSAVPDAQGLESNMMAAPVKVGKAADSVSELSSRLIRLLDNPHLATLASNANAALHHVNDVASVVREKTVEVTNFLTSPSTITRVISYIVALVGQLALCVHSSLLFGILEVCKLLALLLPDNLATRVMELGTEMINKLGITPRNQPQVHNDDELVSNGMTSPVTHFIHTACGIVLGKSADEIARKGSLASLGEIGRATTNINAGIKTMFSWFIAMFEGISDIITRFALVTLSSDADARKFADRVTDLMGAPIESLGKTSFATKVVALRNEALEWKHKREQARNKMNNVTLRILDKNIDIVLRYYKDNAMQLHLAEQTDLSRPTPFTMQFVGMPGQGKSTVMKLTAKTLTSPKNCITAFDQDNLIYFVSPTKHCDGYAFQEVWLHDDMWASRNGDNADANDYEEFLGYISNVPHTVKMANVNLKGAPFKCRLYIGSTNNPYPKPTGLIDHNALWRRRNLVVLTASSNWHDETSASYDMKFSSKGYRSLNHLAFRILDRDNEEAWQSLAQEASAYMCKYKKMPEGWMNYCDLMVLASNKFNQHIARADPPWLDGHDLPNELADLGLDLSGYLPDQTESTEPQPSTSKHVQFESNYLPVEHTVAHKGVCCMPPPCIDMPDDERYLVSFCGQTLWYEDEDEECQLDLVPYDQLDPDQKGAVAILLSHGYLGLGVADECWNAFVAYRLYRLRSNGDSEDGDSVYHLSTDYDTMDPPLHSLEKELIPPDYREWVDANQPAEQHPWIENFRGDHEPDGPVSQRDLDALLNACKGLRPIPDVDKSFITKVIEYIGLDPQDSLDRGITYAIFFILGFYLVAALRVAYSMLPDRPKWDISDTVRGFLHLPKKQKDLLTLSAHEIYTDFLIEENERERQLLEANLKYDKNQPARGVKVRSLATGLRANGDTSFERISTISKNLCRFSANGASINALGIKGHFVLLNKHFLDQQRIPHSNYLKVLFYQLGFRPRNLSINLDDCVEIQDEDVVVVQLPKSLPAFRDITRHFLPEKLCSAHAETGALLMFDHANELVREVDVNYRPAGKISYDNQYNQLSSYQYSCDQDMRGLCMSPLVSRRHNAIVGVHIAADPKSSNRFAKPITKEILEEMIAIAEEANPQIVDETVVEANALIEHDETTKLEARGEITFIGKACKKLAQPAALNSTIVKSPVHGVFPVEHGPAVLNYQRDPRVSDEVRLGDSPHQKGLDKFAYPIKDFDPIALDISETAIISSLQSLKVKIPQRLLTEHEMLNGTDDKLLKRLDLNTSAGWPWKDRREVNSRGKNTYITNLNEGVPNAESHYVYSDSESAREMLEEMNLTEQKIRQGIVPFYVVYENLKDELRPLAKIRDANTRTFDCLPLPILLLTRKYFGTFIAQAHANAAISGISVGIDATGLDWSTLGLRIGRFGNRIIDGDYKNWDGSVSADELMRACSIVNAIYDDSAENQRAREVLMYTFVHSYIVSLDLFARKHQGMPSGVALTAVLNSLVNWLRLFTATNQIYLRNTGEYLSADSLLSDLEVATYGDDHLLAVSESLGELVTFSSLQREFTDHGIVYTDAQKSGKSYDFHALEEVSYLKRSFKPYTASLFVAPLEINSILRSVSWQNKNPALPGLELLSQIKESFRDELVYHGMLYYRKYVAEYNAAVRAVEGEYPPPLRPATIAADYPERILCVKKKLGLIP